MKNNKGITVIALIITIIVMIILAGVAISMIDGENGVITKAENAKVLQEKIDIKEKIELTASACIIENEGAPIELGQLEDKLGNEYFVKEVEGKKDTINNTMIYLNEFLVWDKEKYAFYIDEKGKVHELKIIDSNENGKEFEWKVREDLNPPKIINLKYLDSEYEGFVQFPDYIRYGNELYEIMTVASHKEYKFSEVVLPMKLISSANYTFSDCVNLRKISIGYMRDNISAYMLDGCSNLKEVVFRTEKSTQMEGYVFRNCTSLEYIRLPKYLTHIPNGVFYGCTNLKTIIIGEYIDNIIPAAFTKTNIEKIQINKTAAEIVQKFSSLNVNTYTKGKIYDKDGNKVVFE